MKKIIFPTLLLCISFFIQAHAQVLNKGVGGNNTRQLLERIDRDVLQENPNLVLVMVGANDLLNSRKMISHSEYADNLDQIFSKIKAEGSQVLLMSSLPVDSAYLFTRHEKLLYFQAPNEMMDSASQIVKRVADDNDALFIDLYQKFRKLDLPRHNEDLFIRNQRNSGNSDGVHPTALGYHLISESVFQFLKENKLIQKEMIIVCFGDSITKGAGVDKEKSYSAYLNQQIVDYK